MDADTETAPQLTVSNPLDELLGYHLRRATLALLADLSRGVADLDVTVTEMSVLLLIAANPQITQAEIGRLLSIQRANMTPLSGRLAQRGLIQREAMNGRSNGLSLTEAGAALVGKLRARIAENERRFLSRVSERDRVRLVGNLKALWSEIDER
jgi:DNA-binding MarR family transcriptional regulator